MNLRGCWISMALAGAVWAGIDAPAELTPEPGQADRPLRPEATSERGDHLVRMLDNPRITNALELTDAQKAQIKEVSLAHQKQMSSVRAELETAGIQQAKLISDESTDLKVLMNAVEKTGKVRTEMAKLQIRHLVEVRGILTADQRTRLRDIMRKFHERRGEEGAIKRQQPGEGRRSGEKRGIQEGLQPGAERVEADK